MSGALPANVNLLTLEQVATNQLMLRLEHIYEKGEVRLRAKGGRVKGHCRKGIR